MVARGQPYVYSGSLVTRGGGVARVLSTGPRSEIGRIGPSLATLDTEAPRLRSETMRIGGGAPSRCLSYCCLVFCATVGLMRCWPASRSACRCCPKSFPSY
jgi:magnesium-transporting ATPase (P-type)